ncbi:Hypothetical predicted protein [Mytilus galloprovincialis]|uniref:Uncharacterized protein n=1 Tax=Mytilus galloprovincialis TaxID=29158 RepID=A0A8B6BGQ1_MYTGA|nr:Hypothetical predicted protein [Mytilus galloprovincialis]
MENEIVTKVITLDKQFYGLSFYNNSLASIPVETKSGLFNLVYCNDRVTYSDYNGKVVYCYDGSGKQIWQYTQDLSGPEGLCTDRYGNIIATDYNCDRIIVISKDGQNSKILTGEEDGLTSPLCICFKHNESSGFISDYRGTYLAKFLFSSG